MILAFLWEMPQGDADFLRRLSLACSVPPTDDRPSGIVSAEKISSESLSILAPYKCLRDTIKGSSANDILLPGILGVIVLKSEDIEQGVSKKTLKPYTRSEIVLADGSWASCPVSLWNSQASLVQRLDVGDVILLESNLFTRGIV